MGGEGFAAIWNLLEFWANHILWVASKFCLEAVPKQSIQHNAELSSPPPPPKKGSLNPPCHKHNLMMLFASQPACGPVQMRPDQTKPSCLHAYQTALIRCLLACQTRISFHTLPALLSGFVPVVVIVALLLIKPVTSIMNWFYTQGHFTNLVSGFRFYYKRELYITLYIILYVIS